MASRRKRALPPWLQGVTIKKQEKNVSGPTSNREMLKSQQGPGIIGKLDLASDTEHAEVDGKVEDVKTLAVKSKQNVSEYNSSQKCDMKVEGKRKQNREDPIEEWSFERAVEMSLKEFSFQGTLIYSHNMEDCNLLCDDIISSIDANTDTVVGFDTEWPVTYVKGKQEKTALIQLCLSTDKCYLFHVSCMPKFPVMLRKLIERHHVKKVGLNIEYDFWKLDSDFDIKAKDIIQNSIIELKTLGNKKLRSAENWSLEGLARNVLQVRISKDPGVRKCDWRQFPLPEAQQRYAATDAVISLMIYEKLITR